MNIADEKSMENAAKYFTDRGVYTLLAIESNETFWIIITGP